MIDGDSVDLNNNHPSSLIRKYLSSLMED